VNDGKFASRLRDGVRITPETLQRVSTYMASIGTSTLFAAWNAAVYVAQIDDERLGKVIGERKYLDATREVLQAQGGLWFLDESYVVSRKRA
jgi:propanediol dehydratase small subunit